MLTLAQYQAIYPTSTVDTTKIENWLSSYKQELARYFRFDNTSKVKMFKVEGCSTNLVSTPIFELNDSNLTIQGYDVKTRMLKDYQVDYDFKFRTFAYKDKDYVYALDFGCLNCLCECEMIKVSGLFNPLFDLENYIYSLINELGTVAVLDDCQQIASEKIGEYQVTYRDTSTTQASNKINLDNVFSFPTIQKQISYLQPYFISL